MASSVQYPTPWIVESVAYVESDGMVEVVWMRCLDPDRQQRYETHAEVDIERPPEEVDDGS